MLAGQTPDPEQTVGRPRARRSTGPAGIQHASTLAAPRLILPSLQVNIRGGALPKPSAAGRVFLKLPVTMTEGRP